MNLESRLIRLLVGNNQTVTNGFKALEGEKFIILVGMFIATLSFGILPIRILLLNLSTNRLHAGTNEESVTLSEQQRHRNKNRSRRWKNAISYANCFSGGVFVAACLLDLFPDVHEAVDNVLEEIQKTYHTKKIDYPVAEFIIVLGFFLVLIIEQVILDFKERWLNNKDKEQPHDSNPGHVEYVNVSQSSDEIDETRSLLANTGEALSTTLARKKLAETNGTHKRKSSDNRNSKNNYGSTVATTSTPIGSQHVEPSREHPIQQNNNQICRNTNTDITADVAPEHKYSHVTSREQQSLGIEDINQVPYVSSSPTSQVENTEEHNHDEVFHEDLSTLRSFLLLFALTFHSIFEGLAIGTQPDTMSLLQIFIAVIVHKSIMAFSLGLNLSQSAGMTVKTFMIANLVFSISSPLGMGLGIGISHLHKSLAKDIANGTLQGIAGGTFLYITFFEVLPHEFTPRTKHRLLKVLCVIAGYAVICTILLLTHN